jgi:hypothetical protein
MAAAASGPVGAARAARGNGADRGSRSAEPAHAEPRTSMAAVAALRRQGHMTMLALEQRGSLRTMLAAGRPEF